MAESTRLPVTELEIEPLVIPNSGMDFRGIDLRLLRGPGAYIILREGKPLYIGCSKCLLQRLGGHHHIAKAIEQCDRLLVYPCRSWKAAEELETILIGRLFPEYNSRKRRWVINRLLGNLPSNATT